MVHEILLQENAAKYLEAQHQKKKHCTDKMTSLTNETSNIFRGLNPADFSGL